MRQRLHVKHALRLGRALDLPVVAARVWKIGKRPDTELLLSDGRIVVVSENGRPYEDPHHRWNPNWARDALLQRYAHQLIERHRREHGLCVHCGKSPR